MAGFFKRLLESGKKIGDSKEEDPELDRWMQENGRQKNQWGNYSNADMADYTRATKNKTDNEVANKRAEPKPEAKPKAKPEAKPKVQPGVKFDTEEEMLKNFPTLEKLDDVYYLDRATGNTVLRGPLVQQYLRDAAERDDLPSETITDSQGTVLGVDPRVDAKKLGGIASIEKYNEDGTVTSTPVIPKAADANIAKDVQPEAKPEAKPKVQPIVPTQQEVQEQVTNEIGVDENTSPEEAKQKLLDRLLNEGFVTLNDDGSISVAPYKQSTKSRLAQIGTALSIVLSIATSGVLPALNIGKLTGTTEDEASARQVYDNFMKEVSDTYGDIFKTETVAEEDTQLAEAAGLYGYKSSGSYASDMQAIQNTIATMNKSNANAKDYANFMSSLTAKQLPLAINAAKEAGIPLDEIANYIKASQGTTFWDDALNKANKVTGVLGNVVGAVKP